MIRDVKTPLRITQNGKSLKLAPRLSQSAKRRTIPKSSTRYTEDSTYKTNFLSLNSSKKNVTETNAVGCFGLQQPSRKEAIIRKAGIKWISPVTAPISINDSTYRTTFSNSSIDTRRKQNLATQPVVITPKLNQDVAKSLQVKNPAQF